MTQTTQESEPIEAHEEQVPGAAPDDGMPAFGPAGRTDFERDVLVLGIGNILWADEGFGPRAAELFHATYRDMPGVEVMDGGTLGNYLINEVTSSRRILVFDCCDFHEKPGTIRTLAGKDISLWRATKISPHQEGFSDLLATAALMGRSPEEVEVVGVQPAELEDYGGSLSPLVREALPKAMELGLKVLAGWGYVPERRAPDEKPAPLGEAVLEMTSYEAERPAADEACRFGDERFLVRAAGHEVKDPEGPFERRKID